MVLWVASLGTAAMHERARRATPKAHDTAPSWPHAQQPEAVLAVRIQRGAVRPSLSVGRAAARLGLEGCKCVHACAALSSPPPQAPMELLG